MKKCGRWMTGYRCKKCKRSMRWSTMMDGKGTCPHCGNCARGTIVDCDQYSFRRVYVQPWWKFWVKNKWYWEDKEPSK